MFPENLNYISTTDNNAKIYTYSFLDKFKLETALKGVRPFVKYNLVFIMDIDGIEEDGVVEISNVAVNNANTIFFSGSNVLNLELSSSKVFLKSDLYNVIEEVVDTSREWDTIIVCSKNESKVKELILKKMKPYSNTLHKIFKDSGFNVVGIKDREINFVSSDSRIIKLNTVFVGISGFNQNGAKYSKLAIENGAVALVVDNSYLFNDEEDNLIKSKDIAVFRTDNTRLAFSNLVYNFYGQSQPDVVCSVTGTSGKSSVTDFLRQMWGLLKLPTVSVGTVGIIAENVYSEKKVLKSTDAHYTTPVNGEIYKFLRYFHDKGVNNAVVELSSHGLDQYRLENIKLKAAGFTNLGTDHLDFYGSHDAYLYSKAKLFRENLDKDGVAVLNADIPEYDYLKDVCDKRGIKVYSYGVKGKEFKILSQDVKLDKQIADIEVFGKRYHLELKILPSFQLNNMLCALGLVFATTPDCEKLIPLLSKLVNASGRLEYMGKSKSGAYIYVDFAYKGEALESTIKNIRSIIGNSKKIINVFGTCGDTCEWRTRRYELGTISHKYADISIVTDDSPRTEDPGKIRRDIMQYCPEAIEIETGRKDAIKKAIELSSDGDVILIAGKGHEDYYTLGEENIPYTDQDAVKELFDEGY